MDFYQTLEFIKMGSYFGNQMSWHRDMWELQLRDS